jgi:hypothetical protein
LLVREGARLRAAFEILPDYLRDAEAAEAEVNFSDLGTQLSRSTRAFKLWFSLRYFGIDAFAATIDRTLDLAAHAASVIAASATLEHVAPSSLGIVTFRRLFDDTADEQEIERRNASLAAAVEESGIGLVSSTRLHGRYALRLCILNHTTRREHVDAVLELLATADARAESTVAPLQDRHPTVADGPLGGAGLFAGLARADVELIAARGEVRELEAGTTVLERWEASREFFVVLDGTLSVSLDGATVAKLGAGDFFGELAALDWGAGFGYPRLATVVADSDLRLLVFPDGALPALLREYPLVEERVRASARDRLARR